MAWTWDPDTFAAHWFDEGNDRMPAPLHYRSRFATLEEFADHRAAVRAAGNLDEQDRITALVRTLQQCQLRIEIIHRATQLRDGQRRDLRIVGARSHTHAAVLRQIMNDRVGGNIQARLVPANRLPAALVEALPTCNPGTARPITFDRADTQPPAEPNHFGRTTAYDRFLQATRRPTDATGHAILRLGNFQSPPSRHRALLWCDYTGDGRYAELRTRTHLELRPATSQQLVNHFTTWIDQALQHLREEEEDSYLPR